MSRNYKKNRARGSRKASYKELEYGGYVLIKRGDLSEAEYLKRLFEKNKEIIKKRYEAEYEKAKETKQQSIIEAFTKFHTDSFKYFTNTIQQYRKDTTTGEKISIKKAAKKAIVEKLGEQVERFRRNFVSGLDKAGLLSDLIKQLKDINETFDISRISYEGDAYYHYTAASGKIWKYRVKNSPLEYIPEGTEEPNA